MTNEKIIQLYNLFKPFENKLDNVDMREYEVADQEFHRLILYFSGNKVLQKMEMFGNIIKRTYQRGLIRDPKETFSEHLAIIKALESHDGNLAEELLRKHFNRSLGVIIEQLKS